MISNFFVLYLRNREFAHFVTNYCTFLNDLIRQAKLPAMNSEQEPFMHMEVTKDSEEWANAVVRDFYRKDSVVQIPRR